MGEWRQVTDATKPDGAASDGNLTHAALRGSAVTLVGQGASTLVRFGSNLIITRLLAPEHFGVMALVNVFLMGIGLFSDIGVGPAIIQGKRGDDPVFLDTAWTAQVLRGIALASVACAAGWPLAQLYDAPELVYLVPVTGLTALLDGFGSTKLHTASRSLSFVRKAALDLASQIAGIVAMIGVAWWYRSVWALVVGALVSGVVRTVLTHAILPGHNNRFRWDRDARRALFEFGRWIFVSTAFNFLAGQSDRLILGKLITTAELGVYSIGANIAALPLQIIRQVSTRVFFPVVAAAMRRADHDPGAIRASRIKLMTTLAPVLALTIAVAQPAITLLYDERYHRAGLIATFLAVGTWLGTISSSYNVVLLAAGRPKALSVANGVKTLVFTVPLWLAATHFGVDGAALAIGLSDVAFLVVAQLAARKEKVLTLTADVGVTLGVGALVAVYYGLHRAVLELTTSPVVALAVPVLVALGLTAVLVRKLKLLSRGEPAKSAV